MEKKVTTFPGEDWRSDAIFGEVVTPPPLRFTEKPAPARRLLWVLLVLVVALACAVMGSGCVGGVSGIGVGVGVKPDDGKIYGPAYLYLKFDTEGEVHEGEAPYHGPPGGAGNPASQ